MSYDLQRIVLTFVPSFDPCSQLPLSNLTSSAAPNGCCILFVFLTRPTNKHWQFNILPIRSQNIWVNELLPFSNPPSCVVLLVICIHRVCVCVVRATLCVCFARHQYAAARSVCPCIPPSSLSPSLTACPLPLSLITSLICRHCHSGPSLDGWMGGSRGREIEGGVW